MGSGVGPEPGEKRDFQNGLEKLEKKQNHLGGEKRQEDFHKILLGIHNQRGKKSGEREKQNRAERSSLVAGAKKRRMARYRKEPGKGENDDERGHKNPE